MLLRQIYAKETIYYIFYLVTYYIPVHISHCYNSVVLVESVQLIANWYQMAKSLLFDALNFLAGIKDD